VVVYIISFIVILIVVRKRYRKLITYNFRVLHVLCVCATTYAYQIMSCSGPVFSNGPRKLQVHKRPIFIYLFIRVFFYDVFRIGSFFDYCCSSGSKYCPGRNNWEFFHIILYTGDDDDDDDDYLYV